jgi:hypothetical protein
VPFFTHLVLPYFFIDPEQVANFLNNVDFPQINKGFPVEYHLINILTGLLHDYIAINVIVTCCPNLNPSYFVIEVNF